MINLKKFNPETIIKSALMILKGVAVKVIKFVPCLGRGGTPWVHYEMKNGKRGATFLKKSDFEGYKWNDNYSEVTKLETGDSYKVSNDFCTCPDWEKRVKPGKKPACKHQLMRQDLMKQAGIFDLTNIPPCTRLEKKRGIFESDKAYDVYCSEKAIGRKGMEVKDKMIGYITINNGQITAWRSSTDWGKCFDNLMDAINHLLWRNDLSFNKWRQCYEDKYNPEVFPEEIEENIEDNFDPFGGFNEEYNDHEEELNLDPFGGFNLGFN